ncbi:MAG TPA: Uma2 family endonuclease [Candidatus Angelobacter sp.]|jgi:Uma2 family endonuclease|nr:Uma2 family endonuclease [Candidatus Angelobacter sp.]
MSTSTEIKKMSFEEYERLPEEIRSELYQGELIEMTPGTPKHNDIRDEIAFTLREFVRKNKLGKIYIETAFRLFPDVVLIPDVAYVTTEQLKNADLERAAFLFAPLLAVEVISPANSPLEMIRKRELYLSAGTKTVWIVYPLSRTVKVYKQGSERIETSVLSDSELLPGFSLSIPEVFARADL